MLRRLALALSTAALALGLLAAPAHACGYWDCIEYDGGYYCVWYG